MGNEIVDEFDKFENTRRRRSKLGIPFIKEHPNYGNIWVNLVEKGDESQLDLLVEYNGEDWFWFKDGQLIIRINDVNHTFTPNTHTDETTGDGGVREVVFYAITEEQLKLLADATAWEGKISGDTKFLTFKADAKGIKNFRDFYRKVFEAGQPADKTAAQAVASPTAPSDQAVRAPAPAAFPARTIAVGVVALALVALSVVGYGRWGSSTPSASGAPSASAGSSSPSQVSAPAATTSSAPDDKKATGLPVTVAIPGDSTWTVLDVSDRGQTLASIHAGTDAAKTSGRFLVVHYAGTNDSASEADSPPDPSIIDAKGRSLEIWAGHSYNYYIRTDGELQVLGTENVSPGVKHDYWAIYEVATGAPLKLRFHAMQGKKFRDVPIAFPGEATVPTAKAKSATPKASPTPPEGMCSDAYGCPDGFRCPPGRDDKGFGFCVRDMSPP